jgi:hypothetical protein
MKPQETSPTDEPLGPSRPYTGPRAIRARVVRRRLIVDVDDGRTIAVPLSYYTGFAELPPRAFKNLELTPAGAGVHFPEIDEYICVEYLFDPPSQLRYSRIPAKLVDRRPRPVHMPAR